MNRFLVVLSCDELCPFDSDKIAGYIELLETGERLPFLSLSELDLILQFFRDDSPQEIH